MRRIIIGLLVAAIAAPGAATAEAHKGLHAHYQSLYHAVAERHGKRAPGRNIGLYGVRTRRGARPATLHELGRSVRTFKRWMAPPVPAAMPHDGMATQSPAYAGGNYSIPAAIVMCESHGNYDAVNPSSGARGAYQLLPSTHDALCPGDGWDPAGQDRCAATVWAVQGRGAWVC